MKFDAGQLREFKRKLRKLGDESFAIMKAAEEKAVAPIVADAQRRCPQRSGVMAESIGAIQRTYRGSGTVITVIGPQSGFEEASAIEYLGRPHDPTKIGHLVEYGHGGPHPARPHPFLRPAIDANVDAASAILVRELTTRIERAVANG
ncbi:MAG: HK97 gp10 family phage protein [Candidatus Atribacteria bacterium]|nr:HK97 gp10 family phage protein [Candidatus Atribacteria bacterium]